MQYQADLLGCPVMRSDVAELSATGAALLARKALHKLTVAELQPFYQNTSLMHQTCSGIIGLCSDGSPATRGDAGKTLSATQPGDNVFVRLQSNAPAVNPADTVETPAAPPFSASARICGNSAVDTTAGIINWIKDQTTVLVTST